MWSGGNLLLSYVVAHVARRSTYSGVAAPGSVSRAIVHSIDLLPTIAEIVGVPPDDLPMDIDGMSLVPVLRGDSRGATRRTVFWHYPFYPTDYPGFTPASAIRSGRYKGIYFYEDDRFEVYNLEHDLGETRDLSEVEPEVADRLKTGLDTWLKSVGAKQPRANPAYKERR